MEATALALLVAFSAPGQAAAQNAPYGWLVRSESDENDNRRVIAKPYEPIVGDILFFDDLSPFWERLYSLAGTGPPFHAGIVMKRRNGSLAALESGPDDTLHVYILELGSRLSDFKGVIQVRRNKVPVTPEKDQELTDFAYRQVGKKYAVWRLLLQGTPFRHRGGMKEQYLATTYMDRRRWLCAEIVVTGATMLGIFDPAVVKGTVTYPLDIVSDNKFDLSGVLEPAWTWRAAPPQGAEILDRPAGEPAPLASPERSGSDIKPKP
jgi:hypothetical protein